MDDSISTTNDSSGRTRNPVSECEYSSSEASSWSLYIDDLIACTTSSSSSIGDGSFCSEALSYVPSNDRDVSAKKRKTGVYFVDSDLEDTATSPVCHFEEMENLRTKFHCVDELDHDNHSKTAKRKLGYQIGEVVRSNFNWEEMSYTKLREKGLCLVPVSMLFKSR